MTDIEIIYILCNAAGFDGCYGAINRCSECKDMGSLYYQKVHYPRMKKILESLPWEGFINNPRASKSGEYPKVDGHYITMLDCDEHAVLTNEFKDGHWAIYNETHVKWWMPITEGLNKEIEALKANKSNKTE